ncbi:FtsB family cell division protein [Murimonas intestini]|uniref:Cell division protein DivIC n=1 Tax=Murimonas intestini TaxID=1337051 RepID=A0AB73T3A9_9FIRM|nr:septum formation initiator family protein [Murimonas intestini]MCR1841453.1 septum formation initiator family protein [Murimonas intestini]MCR1866960.1 septum formation initiator family protein [Murimonas intestini]MCR1883982.1 septum formation initiator family protein [Murimonas intestini]
MARKKKRRKRGNKKGMLCISAIVAVLLVSLSVQSNSLKEKNADYAAQEESLRQQIEDEKQRSDDIAAMKDYMKTDEYAEEVAKDKLGLVYKDEILFKSED